MCCLCLSDAGSAAISSRQQFSIFHFPVFHFVVVVAVVPVVAANPRKNYILTFVRGEKGGGQCKTQATRG